MNRRHTDFQSVALPTELPTQTLCFQRVIGFRPASRHDRHHLKLHPTPRGGQRTRHSTKSTKPGKPCPDDPLFPHAVGLWAEKIRGEMEKGRKGERERGRDGETERGGGGGRRVLFAALPNGTPWVLFHRGEPTHDHRHHHRSYALADPPAPAPNEPNATPLARPRTRFTPAKRSAEGSPGRRARIETADERRWPKSNGLNRQDAKDGKKRSRFLFLVFWEIAGARTLERGSTCLTFSYSNRYYYERVSVSRRMLSSHRVLGTIRPTVRRGAARFGGWEAPPPCGFTPGRLVA